jgi:hypothetical protein
VAAGETPAPVDSTQTPDGTVNGGPVVTPTPTDATVTQLPSDVLGQSAAQETCSVGRSLANQ